MKLRSLLTGVCKNPAGLFLVAGAVGVFAAARYMLRNAAAPRSKSVCEMESQAAGEARIHYFRIRRTQSELGYAYWVLQGYGQFRCFELYDTWREACDEALCRAHDNAVLGPPALVAAGS